MQYLKSVLVLKPIPNKVGIIAPWFDEIGLGTQYLTELTVDELIKQGYLLKID